MKDQNNTIDYKNTVSKLHAPEELRNTILNLPDNRKKHGMSAWIRALIIAAAVIFSFGISNFITWAANGTPWFVTVSDSLFNEQLENCGVEYFDYYLLHNMGSNVYERCEKYKAFDFVARMRSEGRIRHAGMSFHDTPALLEEILTKYGDRLDFIQLQINYIDWEEANVQSRKCLEIAQKYNKPVIVMEPCKGGTLVNVPDEAARLMKENAPERSIASWAMRFAAGCPGVIKVLSGMNSMDQLEDNCSVFSDFEPLNEEEMAVIDKVREIIQSNTAIPCTGCEYCTHGCPENIAIPQYFSAYNSIMRTSGYFSSQSVYYNNLVRAGHGKASDCIKCGNCEAACPQHLPIRKFLETVADKMEHTSILPVRKS